MTGPDNEPGDKDKAAVPAAETPVAAGDGPAAPESELGVSETGRKAELRAEDTPKSDDAEQASDKNQEVGSSESSGGSESSVDAGRMPALLRREPSGGSESAKGSELSGGSESAKGSEPSGGSESAAGSESPTGSESSSAFESSKGTEPSTRTEPSPGSEPSTGSEPSPGSEPSTGSELLGDTSRTGDMQWDQVKASAAEASLGDSTVLESDQDLTTSQKLKVSSLTLTQHHVSHLLTDVLEDPADAQSMMKGMRFPMILDCLLAFGLLVAVGGFTVGLLEMYLIHSASQSISEQHYKAAIAILKGAPLPQVFARAGSDTEEMLSKARYLDAIDKLQSGSDTKEALDELGEIRPDSRYFKLAQEAISDNTEAAPVLLQGGAETTETAPLEEKKPSLLEKALKEDERERK